MSCSLPQSEASGGSPLSRSRRLTEVKVTRGCLLGSSDLFHQFTHRHDGLRHSFFDVKDFFGRDCSARSNITSKAEKKGRHSEFIRRGRRLPRLHRRGSIEISCRALATTPPLGLGSTRPVVPSRFHLPWG